MTISQHYIKIIKIKSSDTELFPFKKKIYRHFSARKGSETGQSTYLENEYFESCLPSFVFAISPFKVSKNYFKVCSSKNTDF